MRYFVAVADAGSFTRAADDLHVSQSGVSAQVRQLERALGVDLFDRSARRIRLTPAGDSLLREARLLLASADTLRERADEFAGAVRGTVRLGMVAGLTWPAVFDALAELHGRYPGLDVQLSEGSSAQLADDLDGGALDLAILTLPDDAPAGLRAVDLVRERLVAVLAPDDALAARRAVRGRDLLGRDLVALARGTGARLAADRYLGSAGIDATPRWEVSTPTVARLLIARGLGIGLLTTSTLDPVDGLVRLRLTGREQASTIRLAWRADRASSPATGIAVAAFRTLAPSPLEATADQPGVDSRGVLP